LPPPLLLAIACFYSCANCPLCFYFPYIRAERDVEKEALEKRRLYPYHLHINQDFIEAAHLLSAMLAEVPNLAIHGQVNKKKVISKAFRRLFDYQQRQAFIGPPENTKDLVIAASHYLARGEWEKCVEIVKKMRFWRCIHHSAMLNFVQTSLISRIKEEGVRTYLLNYSNYFSSISLPQLSDMFELELTIVHRLASKLMVNDQLAGAWDQPTQTVQLLQSMPNKLQKAAYNYADKTQILVEQNERLLDVRGTDKWNKGDRKDDQQGGQNQQKGGQRGENSRGGAGGQYKPRGGRNRGTNPRGGYRPQRRQQQQQQQ
jgi:translation initiation factor 3 subunit C